MITADTYVRARIDTKTKDRAADALEAMGLSISDAIRLLMLRIADERRLPFEIKVPNSTTRKAIAELEAGKGKRFASVEALMADCAPFYPTLAEAAMRYVLSAPQLSTLIPGMKNRAEVDMNVAYSDGGAFPEELAARLPRHRWIRNYYK